MSLELALPTLLRLMCAAYLALALIHTLLQARYARRHQPAPGRPGWPDEPWPDEPWPDEPWPSVDVLVPCYNEAPELLDAALESVALQDYPGRLRVFVVDDGSRNRAALLPVLRRHEQRSGWQVLLVPHGGKRRAMDAALRSGDGTVVVTVDSDTVILPDGISRLVTAFADQRVGAVGASLRAMNANANLLTRLINRNYWLLFEQERSAQSHFRSVLCCWGGFTAYRRSTLEAVWERHLHQTFAGRRCTSGDDLHLTLQILSGGHDAVLQPAAGALTYVPASLRGYARQQARWSRSFIRELPLALRTVTRRHPYLTFDLAAQVLMPLLLTAAGVLALAGGVLLGAAWLAADAVLVAITLASTSASGALQARDLRYLLYGPVYSLIVLPGWLRALTSPGRDSWKTRDLPLQH